MFYSLKIPLIAHNPIGLRAIFMGLGASMYRNFNMEIALKPKMLECLPQHHLTDIHETYSLYLP